MKRGFLKNVKPREKAVVEPDATGTKAAPTPANDGDERVAKEMKERNSNVYNLPYGKGALDNVEAPENQFPPLDVLPSTAKAPPAGPLCNLEIATIPSDDTHTDQTQFLYYAVTKNRVLKAPGFPKNTFGTAVPRDVKYEIKECEGMGLGVFATKKINSGELIFAERPFMVVPMGMVGINFEKSGLKKEQWMKMVMDQWEGVLGGVVGRMKEERREEFRKLMNSHTEDGSGEILGIIRTNGYMVEELDGGHEEAGLPEGTVRYTCVGKIASRVNHSCFRNTFRSFDVASFALRFTASRDIQPGEQIFTSYCDLIAPLAERRAELAPYGVVCTCEACTKATPARDAFRASFIQRINDFYQISTGWTNRNNDVKIKSEDFKALLEFQQKAIEEGFDTTPAYVRILSALVAAYAKMGLKEKAFDLLRQTRSKMEVYHGVTGLHLG